MHIDFLSSVYSRNDIIEKIKEATRFFFIRAGGTVRKRLGITALTCY